MYNPIFESEKSKMRHDLKELRHNIQRRATLAGAIDFGLELLSYFQKHPLTLVGLIWFLFVLPKPKSSQ